MQPGPEAKTPKPYVLTHTTSARRLRQGAVGQTLPHLEARLVGQGTVLGCCGSMALQPSAFHPHPEARTPCQPGSRTLIEYCGLRALMAAISASNASLAEPCRTSQGMNDGVDGWSISLQTSTPSCPAPLNRRSANEALSRVRCSRIGLFAVSQPLSLAPLPSLRRPRGPPLRLPRCLRRLNHGLSSLPCPPPLPLALPGHPWAPTWTAGTQSQARGRTCRQWGMSEGGPGGTDKQGGIRLGSRGGGSENNWSRAKRRATVPAALGGKATGGTDKKGYSSKPG